MMTNSMQQLDEFLKSSLNQISEINKDLAKKTSVAVRSLQFEDIVRQVSEHIDRKVISLEDMIKAVTDEFNSIVPDISDEDLANEIRIINEKIEHTINHLNDNPLHKTTDQNSMDEGDVQLF